MIAGLNTRKLLIFSVFLFSTYRLYGDTEGLLTKRLLAENNDSTGTSSFRMLVFGAFVGALGGALAWYLIYTESCEEKIYDKDHDGFISDDEIQFVNCESDQDPTTWIIGGAVLGALYAIINESKISKRMNEIPDSHLLTNADMSWLKRKLFVRHKE